MTDNDEAEWIDVDREFGRRPQGPNNPPPRPRSTTLRPGVTLPPESASPRPRIRPTRPIPGIGQDAPENMPPSASDSYKATTIWVSVVSVIFLVALVALLLYLFVLRKKLKKVQRSQSDSQFALRVEDVTHINIDDSAKLYVNTTDLQKLVSSVRIKNKKGPPPIPTENNYPDVVNVTRPPAPLPSAQQGVSSMTSKANARDRMDSFESTSSSNDGYAHSDENIYANVTHCSQLGREKPTVQIARPAPPPPSIPSLKQIHSSATILNSKTAQPQEKSKPPPPVLPKPTVIVQKVPEVVKPTLPKDKPTIQPKSKALVPNHILNKTKPETLPVTSKPLLPRLKMNLNSSVNRQDSGFSTPDTASSYISSTSATSFIDHVEPEMMSVKDKKALLEGTIANDGFKRNS